MARRGVAGSGRRTTGRIVAGVGLGAVGALHLAWAAGSSFPAPNREVLADTVVGSPAMPGPVPCAVVGVGALAVAAAVAAGRPRRLSGVVRRLAAAGLATRAAAGGVVTARRLGLPEPSERFRSWDARVYRPLCAVLAIAAAQAR